MINRRGINRDLAVRTVRIIVGLLVSVLAAYLAGVEYAPSTAIVTLLGIQSTVRDTLKTAAKRAVTFVFAVLVAYLMYLAAGTGIVTFFLAAAILVIATEAVGWEATLSINIVVMVHLFLKSDPFSMRLVLNETLRVIIGILTALAVNSGIPDREDEFQRCRSSVESSMSGLLLAMAGTLRGTLAPENLPALLGELDVRLKNGQALAEQYADNNLSRSSDYYLRYISMRQSETAVLHKIIDKLRISGANLPGCIHTAEYMEKISNGVSVESPPQEARAALEELRLHLEMLALPSDRREFDRQAALVAVANGLYEMVLVKESFISSLTEQQIERYWPSRFAAAPSQLASR